MSDSEQPIDEVRTTRPRAGMIFKDRRQVPGLAMLVIAALALMGFMIAAAQHHAGWAVGFAIAALVLAGGGTAWTLLGRKRSVETSNQHRRQT